VSYGEFSVCQFFESGDYEYYKRFVDAETAVKAAHFLTHNVAARIGTTNRIIITDGGDCISFEWIYGKGVVFPSVEPGKEGKL